jgi:hypothetical protein
MGKITYKCYIISVFIIFLFLIYYNSTIASAYNKKNKIQGLSLEIISIYPSYPSNNVYSWNDIAIKFNQNVKLDANYKNIKLLNGNKAIIYTLKVNNNIIYLHPITPFSFDKKYFIKIPDKAFIGVTGNKYNTYKLFNLSPENLMKFNSVNRDDYKTSALEFYNYLVNNYPFLEMSKSITGYDFKNNKADIINNLSMSKTSDEFNSNMIKILNKLLPGTHTRPINMPLFIPQDITFIYLNGEYIIINSLNPDIKIGDIVSKINGINIDDYIKNSDNVLISNIDLNRNKLYANNGTFLSKDNVTLTIVNSNSEENDFIILMKKTKNNSPINLTLNQVNSNIINTKILSDNEIAYLKVPTFKNIDFQSIDRFISSIQNYKYLIIDVRNNVGGDMKLSKELMTRIISEPKSVTDYICIKSTSIMMDKNKLPYNYFDETELLTGTAKNSLTVLPDYIKNDDYTVFKTKINIIPNSTHFARKTFILTNNTCFSATEYFCNTLKRIGGATLVGGNTGGDGILFEPALKPLLYDFADISYSYTIGIQEDGVINQLSHTVPDYFVEQNKEDYIKYLTDGGDFSDYDTVLKECLNLINIPGN